MLRRRSRAQLSNITLQVLPFSAGAHTATSGTFSTFEFPEAADADVVFLENLTGSLYVEKEAGVYRYTLAFDHLRAKAWDPDESCRFIGQLVDPVVDCQRGDAGDGSAACCLVEESSRSGNGQDCVEVADSAEGVHALRDSKNPNGVIMLSDTKEWHDFIGGLKDGHLSEPDSPA
ncbi:DUF397 domain-containing protein [Sphaerisporangium siamense]|uniref:DUF397 domain-containing protein n=1 Tax=Sphaerisporangium siamense TaxID=795645 RepID=UPI0021A9C7F6|nr:DUF397 domain-containing protein [Sphaerisporangium siamense]